jgi:ribosome-associated protein
MRNDDEEQDDDRSRRQIARGEARDAGDRSARIARLLMQLPDIAMRKLTLDDDVREAIEKARAVTSNIARRRAERTLASDLRRFDLAEIEGQLVNSRERERADAQHFKLAEQWRAKLIEHGISAAADLPGGPDDELARRIDAAQRERATGKPPGSARALFRAIAERLKQGRS